MLDGEVLGRLNCGACRPCALIGVDDVELVEAGRGAAAREQRVARDLPGGVRARADPERRTERGEQRLCVRRTRQLPDPTDERLRDRVTCLLEPLQVGLVLAALQSRGAGSQNGAGRGHRLGILVLAQLE